MQQAKNIDKGNTLSMFLYLSSMIKYEHVELFAYLFYRDMF